MDYRFILVGDGGNSAENNPEAFLKAAEVVWIQ